MFELKTLSRDAIHRAMAKAEQYRLLHEPAQAQSICYDILCIDPENQEALIALLLALTDEFDTGRAETIKQARAVCGRLSSPYDRAYYEGIICERQARATLRQDISGSGPIAYQWLREAMRLYEQAEAIRPMGNDDALLRWNACVRLIQTHRHVIPADEPVVAFME